MNKFFQIKNSLPDNPFPTGDTPIQKNLTIPRQKYKKQNKFQTWMIALL